MIIVEVEDRATASAGKCVQCGRMKPGRLVMVYGAFGSAPRGYYFFCFDCFGPRIFWKKNEYSITYETPADLTRQVDV